MPRAALGLAQLARMWGGYGARPKLAWLSMAQIHESKHVADPWRFRETCERLDRMLAEWLLRHVPAMRDTLLIVRGDHGIQGKMNGEFMAADEEANAFLHVLVRADLAAADATGAALHANRHAVVTALDLHKTIRAAMGLPSPSLPFAFDILREVVPTRSCAEARIPPVICNALGLAPDAPGILATSLSDLFDRVRRWYFARF